MSIFTRTGTLRAQTQELMRTVGELREKLEKTVKDREFLLGNILTLQAEQKRYRGNDYRDYGTAVQAIHDKYTGVAEWGVLQTGSIIDLRSAFILGEGLSVTHTTKTRAEAKLELDWVGAFRDFNDLDGELDQDMAKEAEIEGKIAIRIAVDENPFEIWPGMISTRFISWFSRKYEVVAATDDYLRYINLKWEARGDLKAGDLKENEFVYAKMGGRVYAPNDAQPKILKCLTMIDRLDKALYDLRQIDHYFAAPTPHFKPQNKAEGELVEDFLKRTSWKIGDALITPCEFTLVSTITTGIDILVKEIELSVKMISGATGIPVHYLGLLDLLKNRATGENTRELIMAATTRERQTWIGVYEEVISKAMVMWNAKFNAQKESGRLDPSKIKVDIPQVTQEHWDRIEKVFIPAAQFGIISKEAAAEQIPGLDLEAEAERRTQREAKEAADAKAEMEAMREEFDAQGTEA